MSEAYDEAALTYAYLVWGDVVYAFDDDATGAQRPYVSKEMAVLNFNYDDGGADGANGTGRILWCPVLTLEETFYLWRTHGDLRVVLANSPSDLRCGGERGPRLSSEALWSYCCARRPAFPTNYVVYHHFRDLGYNVKPGIQYGATYVAYDGPEERSHSLYCIAVIDERRDDMAQQPLSWRHTQAAARQMPAVCKSLLVAEVKWLNGGDGSDPQAGPDFPNSLTIVSVVTAHAARRLPPGGRDPRQAAEKAPLGQRRAQRRQLQLQKEEEGRKKAEERRERHALKTRKKELKKQRRDERRGLAAAAAADGAAAAAPSAGAGSAGEEEGGGAAAEAAEAAAGDTSDDEEGDEVVLAELDAADEEQDASE